MPAGDPWRSGRLSLPVHTVRPRRGTVRRPADRLSAVIHEGGQVVIPGLHGPDIVTVGREGLLRVRFHTGVDEERLSVLVNGEAANVVVVMAVVVVSALHGEIEAAVAP